MSVSPAEAGFFTPKDGVYAAPLASRCATSAMSFFVQGDPLSASYRSRIISAVSRMKRTPFAGVLELNLQFLFNRPKKDSVRFIREHASFIAALEETTSRTLSRASTWLDETQVIRTQSVKRYALPEETPGVHIEIVTLPQTLERGFSKTSLPRARARGSF